MTKKLLTSDEVFILGHHFGSILGDAAVEAIKEGKEFDEPVDKELIYNKYLHNSDKNEENWKDLSSEYEFDELDRRMYDEGVAESFQHCFDRFFNWDHELPIT